jgi:hypothetical protein
MLPLNLVVLATKLQIYPDRTPHKTTSATPQPINQWVQQVVSTLERS